MSEKRPPLFPVESDLTELADHMLAGETPDERSLRRLERLMISWLLRTDGPPLTTNQVLTDTHGREYPATFKMYAAELPSVVLIPGARLVMGTAIQRVMRAKRLLLFSDQSLAQVKITRLMMGVSEPIEVEEGGVSAELFRVMTRYPVIENTTLNCGQHVRVFLENKSDITVKIDGAILGDYLEF
jgi:hypothetical protein